MLRDLLSVTWMKCPHPIPCDSDDAGWHSCLHIIAVKIMWTQNWPEWRGKDCLSLVVKKTSFLLKKDSLMSSVSSLETLFRQCTPASDIAPAWRLTLCAYWVFCHSALLSFDSSRWPSRWCLQKSQFFPPLLSALRPLDLLKLLRQSFISVSPAVCRSPILSYEGGQNE